MQNFTNIEFLLNFWISSGVMLFLRCMPQIFNVNCSQTDEHRIEVLCRILADWDIALKRVMTTLARLLCDLGKPVRFLFSLRVISVRVLHYHLQTSSDWVAGQMLASFPGCDVDAPSLARWSRDPGDKNKKITWSDTWSDIIISQHQHSPSPSQT